MTIHVDTKLHRVQVSPFTHGFGSPPEETIRSLAWVLVLWQQIQDGVNREVQTHTIYAHDQCVLSGNS